MTKSNTKWNDGTYSLFEKALAINPKTAFENPDWARLDFVLVPPSFDEIPKIDIGFPEEIRETYPDKREGNRFPLKKIQQPQGMLFIRESSYGSSESLTFDVSGVVSGHAIIDIVTNRGHLGGTKLSEYLNNIIINTKEKFWDINKINPPFHLLFRVSQIDQRFEQATNSRNGISQPSAPIIFGDLKKEHDENFLYDIFCSIFKYEFMEF